MTETTTNKKYDLEERTHRFAKDVLIFCKTLPKSIAHFEMTKQVVRSATSVGANYIEANEALGKRDFMMRIRICRKEAKETRYWLDLIEPEREASHAQQRLIAEATELMNIFGAILRKVEP